MLRRRRAEGRKRWPSDLMDLLRKAAGDIRVRSGLSVESLEQRGGRRHIQRRDPRGLRPGLRLWRHPFQGARPVPRPPAHLRHGVAGLDLVGAAGRLPAGGGRCTHARLCVGRGPTG